MRRQSAFLSALLIATAALLPVQAAFAADMVTAEEVAAPPDATLSFEGSQMRLILGGSKGSGVLHFKGKDYPFTMKGVSVGGLGVTNVEGVGNVFHLSKAEDFAGRYVGVGIGGALVKSKGTSAFKNKKGVVVQTKSKGEGLALNMGGSGVIVTMATPK